MFTGAELIAILGMLLTPIIAGMGGLFTWLIRSQNARITDKDKEIDRLIKDRDSANSLLMASVGITSRLDRTVDRAVETTAAAVRRMETTQKGRATNEAS